MTMSLCRMLTVTVFICLTAVSMIGHAMQTQVIKKERENYILDIKYPVNTGQSSIDATVKNHVENIQKAFITSLGSEKDLPSGVSGKSSLTINYARPYQTDSAVSIRFSLSTYHRGAAHPDNRILTLNFIKGELVSLADLFKDTDYLKPIVEHVRKKLLDNPDFDKTWVLNGTAAKPENYKKWFFDEQGLSIVFDTYQVAAYVYGPQTVKLPLAVIEKNLKPEIHSLVWGR